MNLNKFIVIIFALFLFACHSEVSRIDVVKNSNINININCEKHRQIDFYIDCDIEYVQQPIMVMDFEFYKGQEQILKGGLDPLAASPKENEEKKKENGKTKWKFYGKLEGNFIPPADTIFTIKPTLIVNEQPGLIINKFELVLVR